MKKIITVAAMAMTTPVGLHTAQSAASIRAGIARFRELSWQDKVYSPFVMASIPDGCLPGVEINSEEIPYERRGVRMLQIFGALREELSGSLSGEKIPIILGLPENPSLTPETAEVLLDRFAEAAGIAIDPFHSRIIAKGRASGLLAVMGAVRILQGAGVKMVLAGGIDTYKDMELLGMLDTESRLKTESSPDGFIPGEGAGVLILTTEATAGHRILGAAVGFEEGHFYSETPYRGEGLSRTFKLLFAQSDLDGKIRTVYSSMNGESHWVKEWGVAGIRHADRFAEELAVEHPADCYGDLGAASGVVMAGLAVTGMQKDYVRGPTLVYASSDHGAQAAILIGRQ